MSATAISTSRRSLTWTTRTRSRRSLHLSRHVERALAAEGTCTGEYLEAEHGPGALELMRTLKWAIDPSNIMNR